MWNRTTDENEVVTQRTVGRRMEELSSCSTYSVKA